MKIFVTNDDGIKAEGIKNLVSALSEVADVYVGAPNEQKSACGHGLTLSRDINVKEVNYPNARKALSITGTPADCVKIGLDIYKKEGIVFDKVFSGINHGSNLGTDTLYSGTVSAAIEGLLCGFPSVAVSVDEVYPEYFEAARELAIKAAKFDFSSIDNNMVLNINVPHLPKDELKGVKITGLGMRGYHEWYKEKGCEDGSKSFEFQGSPIEYKGLDCDANDVGAMQAGYAAITPLHYDLTNYNLIEKVRESGFIAL